MPERNNGSILVIYNERSGNGDAGEVAQELDGMRFGELEVLIVSIFDQATIKSAVSSAAVPFAVATLGGDGSHFSIASLLHREGYPNAQLMLDLGGAGVGPKVLRTGFEMRERRGDLVGAVSKRLDAVAHQVMPTRPLRPSNVVLANGCERDAFFVLNVGPHVTAGLGHVERARDSGVGRKIRIAQAVGIGLQTFAQKNGQFEVRVNDQLYPAHEAMITRSPFDSVSRRIGRASDEDDQLLIWIAAQSRQRAIASVLTGLRQPFKRIMISPGDRVKFRGLQGLAVDSEQVAQHDTLIYRPAHSVGRAHHVYTNYKK